MSYGTYGLNMTDLFGGVGWLTGLGVVTAIVLTIVGYVMFLSKNANRSSQGARFFHFDHFYVEKVLKVIYLFIAALITMIAILTPFGSAITVGRVYDDFGLVMGAFFSGLLSGVLIFLIGQFVCRIMFEYALMFVRLVTDARAIRNTIVGEPGMDGGGVQPVAPTRPTAPAGIPAGMYSEPQAPATWTCQCGRTGNTGSFCGACGRPRP